MVPVVRRTRHVAVTYSRILFKGPAATEFNTAPSGKRVYGKVSYNLYRVYVFNVLVGRFVSRPAALRFIKELLHEFRN